MRTRWSCERNSDPRPSITTMTSAVATSCRARRPRPAMVRAPRIENTASPDDGVDTDEAGSRRAGKGAVGKRVGGERRAPQHDEETHDAGDDRHDRRRLPGVDHEAREHQPASRRRTVDSRRAAGAGRTRHLRLGGRRAKTSVTTKKLTGQPLPVGQPVVAVVGQQDAEPGGDDADEAATISAA